MAVNKTPFSAVYDCFLSKVTDDMYMELTKDETTGLLQDFLLNAIPYFEFPRKNLYDYTIDVREIEEEDLSSDDFVLGSVWGDIENTLETPKAVVDRSYFNCELTSEEINILALLMKQGWVQRQVTSIENTSMKYSGSDFKMTSQANHLSKLLALLTESRRDSFHM